MEDKAEKRKLVICAVCNILIVLMVLGAWAYMMLRRGGMLSSSGLSSLKYYTTLSNLFDAAASAAVAVRSIVMIKGKQTVISRGLFLFKYAAAAAVSVTFIVVLVMLAPFTGLLMLYSGANFWFHLIVPVFTAAEFIIIENFHRIRLRDALLCGIAPLAYGLVYLVNILINGVGKWPNSNDIYGFARWGIPAGIGIFAVIVLIGIVCGCLLRLRCREIQSHMTKSIDDSSQYIEKN